MDDRVTGGSASDSPTILVYLVGALLLAALASFSLARNFCGLRGDYGIASGADRQSVGSRRDRILFFPRKESFFAPYLGQWDGPRLGFPSEVPAIDVEWSGVADEGTDGASAFAIEASGAWRAEIGDAVADSSTKPPHAIVPSGRGPYPVHIRFRATGSTASFKLYEVVGSTVRPVASGLFPDEASAEASRRWCHLALAMVASALVVGAWIACTARLGERGQTAVFHMATAILVAICFFLRAEDRTAAPFLHETMDEYYVAWSGWSMLRGHAPTGWDLLARFYPRSTPVRWFGRDFDLVTPFVHEPPIFPLLAATSGAMASAVTGHPTFPDAPLFSAPPIEAMRLFPVLLSTVGLWMLMVLGRRFFGAEAAIAAGLLYATTPALVIVQRLVKDESLIAVMMLAAFALLMGAMTRPDDGVSVRRTLGRWRLAALGLICAASPLVKIPALFLPLSLAVLLVADAVSERPVHATRAIAVAVVGGTSIGILGLLAYAAALDWQLFWKIFSLDAAREADLANAWRIVSLRVVAEERGLGPGWVDWLWVAALPALAMREPRLGWLLAAYLLTMASAVDRNFVYGWYLIPAYPLLVLGAAASLFPSGELPAEPHEAHESWAWFALALFCLLYAGASLSLVTGGQTDVRTARGFFAVAGALFLLAVARGQRSRSGRRFAAWLVLLLTAAVNGWIALRLPLYYGIQ